MCAMLEMRHVSKSFSGNKVLIDVNLSVEAGEVHALLGENGAGKSTLMKILGGIYPKDSGTVEINGKEVYISDVLEAQANGISIIHQELMLAQHISVAENIFMGREITGKAGIVDLKAQELRTRELLKQYKLDIEAHEELRDLTIAEQQMVEIIRAISFGARIIVMDEPTSSLSTQEVAILYDMIRILKEKQVAVIYISHRINELYDISNRITVLRDGECVGTVITKDTERAELIKMMVGRDLASYYTKSDTRREGKVLQVTNLSDGGRVKDISFDLYKGEILGIAGLVGAGRSEAVKCIFGLSRRIGGEVLFEGKSVCFKSPEEAMAEGFGFVPEDRKMEGLFLKQSVRFNTTINVIPRFLKNLQLSHKKEDKIVDEKIEDMHIKVTGPEQLVSSLSGGNQQKVLIGRWLCSASTILILDEPTRGVDVKTKAEIYALIDKLASEGMSIIMVSSDLPELINMSDRIMVMCGGYSTGILNREEISQESIMTLATTEVLHQNGGAHGD